MNKIIRSIVLLGCMAILAGCGSTLKVTELDEKSGYFPASQKIPHDGVVVYTQYNAEKYSPMLYVKTDEKDKKYNAFFIDSFTRTRKFKKVVGKSELEEYVFKNNLAGKVTSVSDVIGLHNLQKEIGNFLVVEPYVEWKGGYNFEAEFKVLDPADGKVVFHVRNKAFNWDGLDQPLFFPMFNAFMDWIEGKTIPTEAPTEPVAEK